MRKFYFYVSLIYLQFLVITISVGCVPNFGDSVEAFDREHRRNYQTFRDSLSHPVFQPSQAVTNKLMDYILYLTSYCHDRNTALALDYLLKTAGPFGFSSKPANEQEKVLLAASAQAITLLYGDLVERNYDSPQPMHQAEILRLQNLAVKGNPAHPYRPTLILSAYTQPGEDLNLDQGERWRSFLVLITDRRISERQFAAKQLNAGAKADWLNDIILSGYLMNVLPDVEGRSPPRVRGYLDQCWTNDNCWMESQHNYVQWWWPNTPVGMGDGIAPRTLETTQHTLTDHSQISSAIQGMLALSFTRMVTFWGHKLDTPLKIVPLYFRC